MSEYNEVDVEHDEDGEDWPEDTGEVNPELFLQDEKILEEVDEIPDNVWWRDDIPEIRDPDTRKKEIEKAKEWSEKIEKVKEAYDSGRKDYRAFWAENPDLHRKGVKNSVRVDLEKEGLTYDKLADVSEDMGLLAAQDLKALDAKDKIKAFIRNAGPERAQEVADDMLEGKRLSKEAYETISRQVRIHKFDSK